MAHVTQDFGVQSWCFREFKDNRKVAEYVKQIGLKKVELCGVHCSFDDESKWDEAIAAYREAGIQITSIGVERTSDEEAFNRRRFEFLKRAGGRLLNIHFNIANWEKVHPMMQKLGDEYDIDVGLHNHGGYQWTGSLDAVKYVLGKCGPRIGSYLDTAWCIQAGEDPIKWVKTFGKRVIGLHLKDFVFSREGKWSDVVVGTGSLKLPEFVATLGEVGFHGVTTLEYEADVKDPVPALSKCISAIRGTKV